MKLIPYKNLEGFEIGETFMVNSPLIFLSALGYIAKEKAQSYRTCIRNELDAS